MPLPRIVNNQPTEPQEEPQREVPSNLGMMGTALRDESSPPQAEPQASFTSDDQDSNQLGEKHSGLLGKIVELLERLNVISSQQLRIDRTAVSAEREDFLERKEPDQRPTVAIDSSEDQRAAGATASRFGILALALGGMAAAITSFGPSLINSITSTVASLTNGLLPQDDPTEEDEGASEQQYRDSSEARDWREQVRSTTAPAAPPRDNSQFWGGRASERDNFGYNPQDGPGNTGDGTPGQALRRDQFFRRGQSGPPRGRAVRLTPVRASPITEPTGSMEQPRSGVLPTEQPARRTGRPPRGSERGVFIGDSIAAGLAQLHPQSVNQTRVGASARSIAARPVQGPFGWAVISAGSNNPNDPNLDDQLRTIRRQTNARRVTWVLPQNARAASIVQAVAAEFGDGVEQFTAGRDRVHPQSYQQLDSAIRRRMTSQQVRPAQSAQIPAPRAVAAVVDAAVRPTTTQVNIERPRTAQRGMPIPSPTAPIGSAARMWFFGMREPT